MDKIVGSYCDFSWFCFITSDFFLKFWTCIITTTFIWTFTLTRQMQLAHRCHGFDFPQTFFLKIFSLTCHRMKASWPLTTGIFRNVLNSPKSTWFNLSYGTQKRILSEWAQEIEKNISEGSHPGVRPLVSAVSTAALRSSCAGVKGLIEVNTPLETHSIYCPGPVSKGQLWVSHSVDW